jgi:23S rRNA (uracil1939-C5)-methyltransferase
VQSAPAIALGYYKFNSHELLAVEECPIARPDQPRAGCDVAVGARRQHSTGVQEIEFFANSDDTELLAEVYCLPETAAEPFTANLKATLAEISSVVFFAVRPAKADCQGEPKLLGGSGNLTYSTRLASYRVSAGAFFQVNRYLTDELVEIVLHHRGGGATGTALDLYAGVGLFSSVLNRNLKG